MSRFYDLTYFVGDFPPTLSKEELLQAYNPFPLKINVEVWLKTYQSRSNPSALEDYFKGRAQAGDDTIAYTALAHKQICSRRYPVLSKGSKFLLSIPDSRSLVKDERYLLSSLPKVYRRSLVSPIGTQFVDLDLKTAHPCILGWLSGDRQLIEDASGDIHALLGEMFFSRLPTDIRRTVAKTVNVILPSGGTQYAIKEECLKLSQKIELSSWSKDIAISLEQAEEIYKWFWNRYAMANDYRKWVYQHIKDLRAAGAPFRVKWDGLRMFEFSDYLLRGRASKGNKNWTEQDFIQEQRHYERSAFSAILRAYERAMMDRLMLCLKHIQPTFGDIHCFCPMYDGALIVVPESIDLIALAQRLNQELLLWGDITTVKIKRI